MKKGTVKLLTSVLLTGVFAFGAASCGNTASVGNAEKNTDTAENTEKNTDTPENSTELKTFRIGVGGQDGSGVFESGALAVENGYFEEELSAVGFVPEYVYFAGAGPEINEAFAAGEIDAAIVGDWPAFTAKSNGIDNKIIAVTNQKCQYGILTVSDDIKTPKDLEGKKVIVPQGTVTQFFWERYAEAEGIDTEKVEIINAMSDASSLLQTGEADAYVVNRYIVYYLANLGLGTELEIDSADIYTTFVFETTTKILEENPELGTAINKALIRAKQDASANPDAQYAALASDNIPAEAWADYYSVDSTLSNLSPEITQEILDYYHTETDWMVANKIVSNVVEISDFVDTSYYQKAVEALAGE
jgi:sulfonate transport system substrate-binding protein